MQTPSPPSLRHALRIGTQSAHAAIERALERKGLFETRSGYARYLRGWYRLQAGAEALLEGPEVAALLPDWPTRRRARLIAADLACLGSDVPSVPRLPAELPLAPAAILGLLYVLEGSTLGSAVLLSRLREKDVAPVGATRFLEAGGAHRGASWRTFLDALETQASRIDPIDVVAAARTAFGWAHRLLCGVASALDGVRGRRRAGRRDRGVNGIAPGFAETAGIRCPLEQRIDGARISGALVRDGRDQQDAEVIDPFRDRRDRVVEHRHQ